MDKMNSMFPEKSTKKLSVINRVLSYFQKDVSKKERYHITWVQFVYISFVLSFPTTYLILLLDNFTRGGLIVFVIIGLFSFFLALPLNFFYVFMGMYTKRSFLLFWKIMPLFKGTGYITFTVVLFDFIRNITISCTSMFYFIKVFRVDIPWIDCSFVQNVACLNMFPILRFTYNCCEIESAMCTKNFPFPTFVYYREIGSKDNMIITVFNYMILSCFVIMNFRKFSSFLYKIILVYSIVLLPIMYLTIYQGQLYTIPDKLAVKYEQINGGYLLGLFIFSIYCETPGGLIGLGALVKAKAFQITSAVFTTLCIKLIVLAFMLVWQSVSIQTLQDHYKIDDINCLKTNGIEFYFTIIPDIMTRWHLPQIWLLIWFSLLYFWSLSSCVCMLVLNVNALLEAYTSLEPYRNMVIIICCIGIFIFDRLTVNYRDITLMTGILMILMIMFFVTITIISYTLKRVATDYHFVLGIKLDSFWVLVLKIAMFINSIFCIWFLVHKIKFYNTPIFISLALLAAFPILVSTIWGFIKYIFQWDMHPFQTHPEWGPCEAKVRSERRIFYPEKKTKFNDRLLCPHTCIVNSPQLQAEIEKLEKRFFRMKEKYQKNIVDEKEDNRDIQQSDEKEET